MIYLADPTVDISTEDWDAMLEPPYPGLLICCADIHYLREKIRDIKEVGWTYFTADAFLDSLEVCQIKHDMSFSATIAYLEKHARSEVSMPTDLWCG